MRDRIWYEMFQVKMNTFFLAQLLKRKKNYVVLINSITLIAAFTGVSGWKVWSNIPIIACAIICFLSILKVILPNYIGDEKYIIKIEEVHKFYTEYYQRIEELWFKMEEEDLNEDFLRKIFYRDFQKKEIPYTQKVNDIMEKASLDGRCKKEAEYLANSYFQDLFKI